MTSCLKELAIRTKQGIPIEDEEGDRFDEEEAFKKRREHFQKTKSRSEHKSILIRVSSKELKEIANLYLSIIFLRISALIWMEIEGIFSPKNMFR